MTDASGFIQALTFASTVAESQPARCQVDIDISLCGLCAGPSDPFHCTSVSLQKSLILKCITRWYYAHIFIRKDNSDSCGSEFQENKSK